MLWQARTYLNPEDILKGEIQESLNKVLQTLDILQLFRQTYEENKGSLGKYYKHGEEVREWDFSSLMVFAGMDCFLTRVETLEVRPACYKHNQ